MEKFGTYRDSFGVQNFEKLHTPYQIEHGEGENAKCKLWWESNPVLPSTPNVKGLPFDHGVKAIYRHHWFS